jgi:hypothetical protein
MQYNNFTSSQYNSARKRRRNIIVSSISLLLVVGLAVFGAITFLNNTPKKKAEGVASSFLAAIYSTNAQVTRSLASGNLQIVKQDNELKVADDDVQKINNFDYSKVEQPDKNTVLLAGLMKSTQPSQTVKNQKPEVISNSFALRMIKEGGSWKVDAYQID